LKQSIVLKHNSVDDFKLYLENQISEIENTINYLSNILGEKIRENEQDFSDDSDFLELKAKLETKEDQNNKKKPTKKQKNAIWYTIENIQIYNGVGTKGELEIYFKCIEELKTHHEELLKINKNLTMIIEKGLKSDLGCIAYYDHAKIMQIVLLKSNQTQKYSFKTSFTVMPEVLTR